MSNLVDSFDRQINYMRVSVTDRCDLRCIYCASTSFHNQTHEDTLRYEEIARVVQAAATIGVSKIRLTGGEPLVRLHLDRLVSMLVSIPGIEEVSMTTNGTLLTKYAAELKAAGLKRVNISLDSLKPDKFAYITGGDKLNDVLQGIKIANDVGLVPVKINMVVLKGINDDEILDFARKTITDGWNVRFIEHMPFTGAKKQDDDLVSSQKIMAIIRKQFGELEPRLPGVGNGPAKYYKLPNSKGTLGFIGAVTECFCAQCNRFRLTSDGKLRPCLLDDDETDIREPLRHGATIAELAGIIQSAASVKRAQHSLSIGNKPSARSMRQIGG
jgi:cyclic pyranopterin phosphate synthase